MKEKEKLIVDNADRRKSYKTYKIDVKKMGSKDLEIKSMTEN